jgi:hypothetical protein
MRKMACKKMREGWAEEGRAEKGRGDSGGRGGGGGSTQKRVQFSARRAATRETKSVALKASPAAAAGRFHARYSQYTHP